MEPGLDLKQIVVGLDGSEQSAAALEWAIAFARTLQRRSRGGARDSFSGLCGRFLWDGAADSV